jgi:hypothetical protein
MTKKICGVLYVLIWLAMNSCAVKWVADYRKDVEDAIVTVAKDIDSYYGDLISIASGGVAQFTESQSRADFERRYRKIDADLYAIYLKNQARPLNKEATRITKSILEQFWRKYKGDLGTKAELLEIHRQRFTRNFEGLLKAEKSLEGANSEQ